MTQDIDEMAKPPPIAGLFPLWSRPGYVLRRLHQISAAVFLEEMADLALTPVQFGAMTIIAIHPGIEQSTVAAELGIDRANMADVVARLIKNGLAFREVSARDRRVKQVYLTEQGIASVKEGDRRLKRVQERLLEPLDEPEREVFVRLMWRLTKGNNALGRAVLHLRSNGPELHEPLEAES